MYMDTTSSGFRERPHTADWALDVWASNLPELFEQAARGMYALLDARMDAGPHVVREFELKANDPEGLLVSFLSELLWLGESDGLGFDRFALKLGNGHLRARVEGAPIHDQTKEIKAVTYHALRIKRTGNQFQTTITFDV